MAFDLGFDFGLVLGFEAGSEVVLLVSGCGGGCRGRMGAGFAFDVVDAPDADRRARVGFGRLWRDSGGDGREVGACSGAAIGEEERVTVSGTAFAVTGLEKVIALSLGGGLVAL